MKKQENGFTHVGKLRAFAEQKLEKSYWVGDTLTLTPLPGDAGFRQYFRLNTRVPMLAVWAPPETEDSVKFCSIARFLLANGVRAPRIFALDVECGFLVVEDFGDTLLQTELIEQNVDGYYSEAMAMLLHMQSANVSESDRLTLPHYNERLLHEELSLFEPWYLEKWLQIELSVSEKDMLRSLFSKLVGSALAQKQVFVHRDFHSRNLIIQGNGALATIDFQDAVLGPFTYDLVSLLKDCYVVWDINKVEGWARVYASMADAASIVSIASEQDFLRDFHWMGLQRHIKVLGIFVRLYMRDNKPRYLQDLPAVLNYVLVASELYPEFESFSSFLKQRVLPLAKQRIDDWEANNK